MSWRFPRYQIFDADVIDYHAWNENAIPFVEEATGMLNEHNFKYGAFNDLSKWDDDVGYRLHHVQQAADPNSYRAGGSVSNGVRDDDGDGDGLRDETGIPPNFVWMISRGGWARIDDMIITLNTPAQGAQLWIQFSAQFELWRGKNFDIVSDVDWGAQFAIRVDGAVVYESLVGSGELDNDPASEGAGVRNAPAIWGRRYPVSMDCIVEVPPGAHVVEVVFYSESANYDTSHFVSNRELIVLEML
jgi:hypothetical protein